MSALADSWLVSAMGSRVKEFYSEIGITLRGEGQNAQVSCFANPGAHKRDDRNASCSVNLVTGLFKCHGCGQSGNAYQAALALGYAERRAAELARQHGLFLEVAKDERKERLPDERKIAKWNGALRCSVQTRPGDVRWTPEQVEMSRVLLTRLWEVKGWTPRAVVRCNLGWDGERIVFAIRDKNLKKVGVVRYLPGGSPKTKALPGSKRLLFPAPEVLSRKKPLFLVEGEPDAVSVRSLGLQAVAVPGANGWRPEFAQRLWGFNVVVLPDADAPGRDLAQKVGSALPNCKVVELFPERSDGADVGDFIVEAVRMSAAPVAALREVGRFFERLAA